MISSDMSTAFIIFSYIFIALMATITFTIALYVWELINPINRKKKK